ncbi:MAG: hypothetical protein BIFFINMI_01878 [Phycisphaerae bacterium]|nr:hypothetical protein [Phycisphaerae bacterium]
MIIDSHQHTRWHGWDDADIVAYLDSVGVDKAWLLSWEAIDGGLEPTYMHLSIPDVLECAGKYPDRFIPFAGYDPRRTDAERLLREAHARGARGYGEIKVRTAYDSPDVIRMFRVAGELSMPVVLHLQYPTPQHPTWWYGGTIDALARAARACPDTNIIAHAQSWWAHISGDGQGEAGVLYPKGPVAPGGQAVRMLAELPNLYADLSAGSGHNGITRDPAFGRQFVIDFADKLLYGVDGRDDKLITTLRGWDLPADVLDRILWRNANRLLPI